MGVASGSDGQAATNDDKVGSTLDQELEKGLDPRISITEAHKSSEKAAQKEGSTSTTGGDATEETAGPLAFLGLQRKESREDTEEKKDEREEDKDVDSNDVFEEKEKKIEDAEDNQGDKSADDTKVDKTNEDNEEMEVEKPQDK